MQNINILKHFESRAEEDFIIFSLKDDEWTDFLSKLPFECRECFISSNNLKNIIEKFNSTKEDELSEILPTKGSIKSGDFGEILAYFLLKELYEKEKIDGPRKWRWKENKDVAAPYSDVILFSRKNIKEYSKDDLLVSAESKMKAVANRNSTPIQNAIDGAKKDYISRIAKSLCWFRKKYKDESLKDSDEKDKFVKLVQITNRYIESEKYGEYTKKVKAIALMDKNFFEEEKGKPLIIPNEIGLDLEIFVVGIKDLKEMYEYVYSKIPKL